MNLAPTDDSLAWAKLAEFFPSHGTVLDIPKHIIAGKRVLVTGAGGSVGSEICRQVAACEPASLVLLDRDEYALHSLSLSLFDQALLDTPNFVLADIRDADTVREHFLHHRPEVVFHSAALKHQPLLEQYPREAWKTNVLGTANVLAAAQEVDVERFVTISTDKAADPTTYLGHSKHLAERLTAWMGQQQGGKYVSVRFGNVIASRGSAIWTFRHQLLQGVPVTVVHPEASRYFMSISQACSLVLQAAAIGESGEVLVLDMGQPVKIVDLVAHLAKALDVPDYEVVFTGLRPGEKLHEVRIGYHESNDRPRHPMISHVQVPLLDPALLGAPPW
ncbi:polysaccharide biosynthesis protein [Buchananella hordeovulneris]|uniref:polysaccharide biosynthesis protein n=1 Tax=Buchananella hordeovulneris TaxID=52770 RepID=UPI0026DCD3D0|nr:polysaccharide biosynthesis protein [Buchananella hordeovulneris]MDO5079782.1 polysaccharide biosynthesis protein [Buchananella hordeovulneris]